MRQLPNEETKIDMYMYDVYYGQQQTLKKERSKYQYQAPGSETKFV